jgi:hypothetical protein
VAHGFVVEIEDCGLGIAEPELTEVNQKLAHPPDFSLADASRLGHYVVAKLAQRHGLRVHLRTSPYGGITAIVLIPRAIMTEPDHEPPELTAVAAPAPPDGGAERPAGPARSAAAEPARSVTGEYARPVPEPPARPVPEPPARPVPEPPVVPDLPLRGLVTRPPARGQEFTRPPAGGPEGTRPPAGGPQLADLPPLIGRVEPAPGSRSSPASPASPAGPAGPDDGSDDGGRTPSGLPWRVRQASLPRQLADDSQAGEPTARDPELVRRAMRSYQLGTQRGRSDADGSPDRAAATGPAAQSSPEPPADRQEG